MNTLIKKIEIIANQNPDGFTVNLENMEFITFGFIASYKETQNSFDAQQLESVIAHSLLNDKIIGGWRYNNQYYYDSCKVFDTLDEAKKFAIENEQIAIFDLTNGLQIIIK